MHIQRRNIPSPQPTHGFSTPLLIGAVMAAAILLLVGVVTIRQLGGGGRESLPVSAVAAAPKNFAGNTYTLEARIDRQVGFEDGVGRILLVAAVDSNAAVPLFVPASLTAFSPSPGQIYRFAIRVDGDGVLNVENYDKR